MLLVLATTLGAVALTFTGTPDAMAGTAKYTCPAATMTPSECKAVYNRFKANGVRVWGYHSPSCTYYYCYDGYFYYAR
ncbi:hypothetical protein [Jiangella muralis]|uniref:hypothetical protein n=1 Tax=Jiangella muralis TaxID=702383 RepID=UPI00069F8E04|nr:hypothetical protein [Jiangella muralis]